MSGEIINGKNIAKEIKKDLKNEISEFINDTSIVPKLTVVLVGDDGGSLSYVKGKQKACEEVGINSELIHLKDSVKEEELLKLIKTLNEDITVNGILVQLPLPKHIDENKVINMISLEKDVDGFHPINVGNMSIGMESLLPCTPAGIIELIKRTDIDIEGKHAVVVGRSNIVGKPVAQLLLNENATVTISHSRTKNLKNITSQGDILVVAVGKPNFIKADMVKKGAVVIDVGTNRLDSGKLCGDVDFDSVKEIASYITPVPKGVGPMTITMLLKNTIKACKKQKR